RRLVFRCSMTIRALFDSLFPYPTLFRSFSYDSIAELPRQLVAVAHIEMFFQAQRRDDFDFVVRIVIHLGKQDRNRRAAALERTRSEEHTSELQSRENIVCRLLLEKKNKK